MTRTFMVTFEGKITDRESTKVQAALQKALAKWFKKGHAIKVEEA